MLAKLPKKDLARIQKALRQLSLGKLNSLDVKTLKGQKDIYRLRVGNYRIIFKRSEAREILILLIAKRDERTYSNF